MAQLLCSRASEPDDARWWTLAAMVEAAAGTVGGRSGPTGGRVDGSETRKLWCEVYAREEIIPVVRHTPEPLAVSPLVHLGRAPPIAVAARSPSVRR